MRVLCWLWNQESSRTVYTDAHVRTWSAMIRRHLTLPHTLAVVTDLPGDYGDIEVISPPGEFGDVRLSRWGAARPQCLRRLSMYRRDAARLFGAETIVCMDLDIVICAPIDALFAGGEDFRIARGTRGDRPYNGSIQMIRAGARSQVYDRFNARAAEEASSRFVGSDQAFLMHILGPDEPTWGPADGVVPFQYLRRCKTPRIVTYQGSLKPWITAKHRIDRIAVEHYR